MLWKLAGGVLIGLGLWSRVRGASLAAFSDFTVDLSILLIVIGAVALVVCFFACLGALREQLILLKIVRYIVIFSLKQSRFLLTNFHFQHANLLRMRRLELRGHLFVKTFMLFENSFGRPVLLKFCSLQIKLKLAVGTYTCELPNTYARDMQLPNSL